MESCTSALAGWPPLKRDVSQQKKGSFKTLRRVTLFRETTVESFMFLLVAA
jgi:hypothetical protein